MVKRLISFLFLVLWGISLAHSQSLVEVARKERERRANLKRGSVVAVTNADLYARGGGITASPAPSFPPRPKPGRKVIPERPPTPKRTSLRPSADQESLDQMEAASSSRDFATRVLDTTQYVEKSGLALDRPDGRLALLRLFGFLDLEVQVANGPGPDLAVYAQRPTEGILPDTMNYGVFASYRGEWRFIGTGGGSGGPETFDLGEIPSTEKIRLVFKDYTQVQTNRPLQAYPGEYAMGIDAVQALHQ